MADGPVSRILCGVRPREGRRAAAIIPLGHASRRDSSSLPEGSPLRRLAPSLRERVRFREFARRAGPALPSYLALHHAGFSMLPVLLPGRWALTPPFHPCQTNQLCPGYKPGFFEDVSQVSLRDATVLCRRRYI